MAPDMASAHLRASEVWQALAEGAAGRPPALRQCVLCTSSGAGADGRTVVLRAVDAHRQALTFYSDRRAAKLLQLEQPAAAVFWDPEAQLQVRLYGQAEAVADRTELDAHWQKIGEHARQNYRGQQAPGCEVPNAIECAKLGNSNGRENFAVVRLSVSRLDALWLSRQERLQVDCAGGEARWVQL